MTTNEIVPTRARHSSFCFEYGAIQCGYGTDWYHSDCCHFVPHDGSLKYMDAAKGRIDQPGYAMRPTFAVRSHVADAGFMVTPIEVLVKS
jgi:hypothetical protein